MDLLATHGMPGIEPITTTSAITDREIGQKGSHYRRTPRKPKGERSANEAQEQSRGTGAPSQHVIDIRI